MTDSKDFVVFSGTATKYLAEKICHITYCCCGGVGNIVGGSYFKHIFLVSNICLYYNYFKSCISYNHYQKAFDILSGITYTFCSE